MNPVRFGRLNKPLADKLTWSIGNSFAKVSRPAPLAAQFEGLSLSQTIEAVNGVKAPRANWRLIWFRQDGCSAGCFSHLGNVNFQSIQRLGVGSAKRTLVRSAAK